MHLQPRYFAIAIAAILSTAKLHAAGFQLVEHSASGAGRAFAGEAIIADNAAVLSRNPAAMARFKRPALSAALSYIAPDIYVRGNYDEGSEPFAGANQAFSNNDVVDTAFVPAFYYIHPIDKHWHVGFASFSNFGLASTFPADYIAGSIGGASELLTVNLNPNVSYRINPQWTVGAGLNIVYGDAKFQRRFGQNGFGLPESGTVAQLEGDGWGYGYNLGLMWEYDADHRLGLAYRSKVDIDFKGDYNSDLPLDFAISPTGPVGTGGAKISGDLTLNLPDILEFSGYHRLDPKYALHYSLIWIGWSKFKTLRATTSQYGTVINRNENFSDSYRIGLGGTWYAHAPWELRAGLAFDRTPSRRAPSISIPDEDRWIYSTGASYTLNGTSSIDGGIFYISGQEGRFEEEGIAFKSRGEAWVLSVQYNHRF